MNETGCIRIDFEFTQSIHLGDHSNTHKKLDSRTQSHYNNGIHCSIECFMSRINWKNIITFIRFKRRNQQSFIEITWRGGSKFGFGEFIRCCMVTHSLSLWKSYRIEEQQELLGGDERRVKIMLDLSSPPDGNSILHLFGSWLFEGVKSNRNG